MKVVLGNRWYKGAWPRSGEARWGEGKASKGSLWSESSGQLGPSSAGDPLRGDVEYSSEVTHLGSWILELYPLELLPCPKCTGLGSKNFLKQRDTVFILLNFLSGKSFT